MGTRVSRSVFVFVLAVLYKLHIEGFQPERCISAIIMLEIHHSGREPSILFLVIVCYQSGGVRMGASFDRSFLVLPFPKPWPDISKNCWAKIVHLRAYDFLGVAGNWYTLPNNVKSAS